MKKHFTKDIRFLLAVFVSVFVAFGGLALGTMLSDKTPVYGANPKQDTSASVFYFKAPVLRLAVGAEVGEGFLVKSNVTAIVSAQITGSGVQVDLNPFAIRAVSAGVATLRLEGVMRDGTRRSITCQVAVAGVANDAGDEADDGDGGDKPTFDGTLSFVTGGNGMFNFNLVVDNSVVDEFVLTAVVVSGDVEVDIFGRRAQIFFLPGAVNFEIEFTATVGGEVVAVVEITQNCL
jgi:hypothetical protein